MALKKNKPVNCPFMIGKLFNSKPKALTIFFLYTAIAFYPIQPHFYVPRVSHFGNTFPFPV